MTTDRGRLTSVAGLSVCLGMALCAPAGSAQQADAWDFRSPALSRQALEQVLARYDAASRSTVYSDALRGRARSYADSIRTRLRLGDVRVGDRMRVWVDGQPQLSDSSAVVSTGPALVLPGVPSIPLEGVLRSELQPLIARSIDQVYRGAVVRVQLLTQVAVIGGVPRPGFYTLSPQSRIEDAITAAGGLAGDVPLRGVSIERANHQLWAPDSLQAAFRDGRTLADLGIEDGDRIVVPRAALPPDPYRRVQILTAIVTIPVSVFSLLALLGWWTPPGTR